MDTKILLESGTNELEILEFVVKNDYAKNIESMFTFLWVTPRIVKNLE